MTIQLPLVFHQISSKRKGGGPIDRSLGSCRLCVRHVAFQPREELAEALAVQLAMRKRSMLERLEELLEARRLVQGSRSWDR